MSSNKSVTYHVRHDTTYEYVDVVSMSHNLAHLEARTCARQTRRTGSLRIEPTPAVAVARQDYFGNPVTAFTIQEPHRSLSVRAENVVDVHPEPVPEPAGTPAWEAAWTLLREGRDADTLDAYQYAFDSPYVRVDDELAEYAAPSFPPGRPILEAALDLTKRIHTDFRYDPTATTTATPLKQVLELRRGVCQDFAHLEIGCLRSLGLAARYVSGYLLTTPPPGRPRLIGADASHAWVSVYCPGFGWVDLDPTNNQIPGEQHILLAWGRDYDDVSPVNGVVLGGGKHFVAVAVDVVKAEDAAPAQFQSQSQS
ncbi:MAG: transglutaminase family protein [Isosphaeraceae bacterium]